ncbi:MAG: 4Fe-4S binding protein [bacterium]
MAKITNKTCWQELPIGGILPDPGSAAEYHTGGWRSEKPVWIEENCIHCLFCWMACPDSAIQVKDGKFIAFNYDVCKGCGICEHECPGKKGKKAIIMEAEGK